MCLTAQKAVDRLVGQRVLVGRIGVDGRVGGDLRLWVRVDVLGRDGGEQSHDSDEQQLK